MIWNITGPRDEEQTDGWCSRWWNGERQWVSDKDRQLAPVDRWPTMRESAGLGYTMKGRTVTLPRSKGLQGSISPTAMCVGDRGTDIQTVSRQLSHPKTLVEWNPGHASCFYFLPLSRPELRSKINFNQSCSRQETKKKNGPRYYTFTDWRHFTVY